MPARMFAALLASDTVEYFQFLRGELTGMIERWRQRRSEG